MGATFEERGNNLKNKGQKKGRYGEGVKKENSNKVKKAQNARKVRFEGETSKFLGKSPKRESVKKKKELGTPAKWGILSKKDAKKGSSMRRRLRAGRKGHTGEKKEVRKKKKGGRLIRECVS